MPDPSCARRILEQDRRESVDAMLRQWLSNLNDEKITDEPSRHDGSVSRRRPTSRMQPGAMDGAVVAQLANPRLCFWFNVRRTAPKVPPGMGATLRHPLPAVCGTLWQVTRRRRDEQELRAAR